MRPSRKELIELLTKVVNNASLHHTEKCVWQELSHGGDCNCAVSARSWTRPPWRGLKAEIEDALARENNES